MRRERKLEFQSSKPTQNSINTAKFDAPKTNIIRDSSLNNQKKNERNQSPSRSRLPIRSSQKRNSPQKKDTARRVLKPPKFDVPTLSLNSEPLNDIQYTISSTNRQKNENATNNSNFRRTNKLEQNTSRFSIALNRNQKSTTSNQSPIFNMQDIKPSKPEVVLKKENKIPDQESPLSSEIQLRPVQKIVPPKQNVKVHEAKVDKEETMNLINSLMNDSKEYSETVKI